MTRGSRARPIITSHHQKKQRKKNTKKKNVMLAYARTYVQPLCVPEHYLLAYKEKENIVRTGASDRAGVQRACNSSCPQYSTEKQKQKRALQTTNQNESETREVSRAFRDHPGTAKAKQKQRQNLYHIHISSVMYRVVKFPYLLLEDRRKFLFGGGRLYSQDLPLRLLLHRCLVLVLKGGYVRGQQGRPAAWPRQGDGDK